MLRGAQGANTPTNPSGNDGSGGGGSGGAPPPSGPLVSADLTTSYGTIPTSFVGTKSVAFNSQYYDGRTSPATSGTEPGKSLVTLLQDIGWNWVQHSLFGADVYSGNSNPIGSAGSSFSSIYEGIKRCVGGVIAGTNYGTANPFAIASTAFYAGVLSTGNSATDTSNFATTGGNSPSNHSALMGRVLTDIGSSILYEPYNEPGVSQHYPSDANSDFDWCTWHHRNFASQIRADHPTVRIAGHATSDMDITFLDKFAGRVNGSAISGFTGATYPFADSNLDYCDTVSFHGYPITHTNLSIQSRVNGYFWQDTITDPTNWTNILGHSSLGPGLYRASLDKYRGLLNSTRYKTAGYSGIKLHNTEQWGGNTGGWTDLSLDTTKHQRDALYDVCCFITHAQQPQFTSWNATGINCQAFNAEPLLDSSGANVTGRAPITSDKLQSEAILATVDSTIYRTARYYTWRDLIVKFSNKYKVLRPITLSSIPNSPGGTLTNGVTAVQAICGTDPSNPSNVGILAVNTDCTNAQTVSLYWASNATSNAAVTTLPSTLFIDTPLTTGSLVTNGVNQVSVTFNLAEAKLIEFTV